MPNVGYMVLIRNKGGHLEANWDGEIHPTQAAVNEEIVAAKRAGFDAFSVSLISRKIIPKEGE